MRLSYLPRWLIRNTSLTLPTSLCVVSSWARPGFQEVTPAESWPRFWMSRSIRGSSRDASSWPWIGQSGLVSASGTGR